MASVTGAIYIGGGVPKNYIQQLGPHPPKVSVRDARSRGRARGIHGLRREDDERTHARAQRDLFGQPRLGTSPASGQAPLSVGFTVNVSGAQGAFSVSINYGDGTTGSNVASTHICATAGSYAAAFSVATATQSALCSTVVRVDAAPVLTPTPTPTNQAPSAVFRTTPEPGANGTFSGRPPLTIPFNMCPTSNPEGDKLSYRMDFEGDGVWLS